MFATRQLLLSETKLFLREPVTVFFAVVFPVVLLLVLGNSIPGFKNPDPNFGGERAVDGFLTGMMILLSVMTLAVSVLPSVLVSYRERGVLRRMSTTPVRPAVLLGVQLTIYAAVAATGAGLTLLLGNLIMGVPAPRAPLWFLAAFALGTAALFAIGLCLAAVVPNSRVMQAAGVGVLFPLLFVAGMWLPRDLMPAALRTISDYSPTGPFGQALRDTLAGHAPDALHLAVLAGWTLVAGLVAVRLFRWE
jgi:ABC-2 type transport system permease protein